MDEGTIADLVYVTSTSQKKCGIAGPSNGTNDPYDFEHSDQEEDLEAAHASPELILNRLEITAPIPEPKVQVTCTSDTAYTSA